MIVMLPKKRKLLKTLIIANCEEVGGQGRELGKSGKESRSRPRPIRWLTAQTASADQFDSLGRPVEGTWPTDRFELHHPMDARRFLLLAKGLIWATNISAFKTTSLNASSPARCSLPYLAKMFGAFQSELCTLASTNLERPLFW